MKLVHRIITLAVVCLTLLPIHAQETTKRVIPFLTAGYNYSDFNLEGLSGRNSFNVGGGAIVPLFNRGLVGVRPQLLYIQKGARRYFDVYNKERTIKFDANYIELPIDFVLSGRPLATNFNISAFCGIYFAYGVGGKTTASDGIYIYHRYHVGDKPSTFGEEMNGHRFDWGCRLGVMARFNNCFLTLSFEPGFEKVLDGRIVRSSWDAYAQNMAFLVNVGFELPTVRKQQ